MNQDPPAQTPRGWKSVRTAVVLQGLPLLEATQCVAAGAKPEPTISLIFILFWAYLLYFGCWGLGYLYLYRGLKDPFYFDLKGRFVAAFTFGIVVGILAWFAGNDLYGQVFYRSYVPATKPVQPSLGLVILGVVMAVVTVLLAIDAGLIAQSQNAALDQANAPPAPPAPPAPDERGRRAQFEAELAARRARPNRPWWQRLLD